MVRELERSDSTGFYDSLSARICAFVALAPLADEPKVEAVMERAVPLVTQGRQLEQEVIVAASQETAELRSKLFEEADWEKIVDMYCDQSTEVDTVEPALYPMGYRQLWTAFRQFNSDYKMPDDYRIVLANRDALQSVRQEAITYGHIQQSDQPWEMPEGWQPNPAVTTESYNLKTAQKYLAPLRRSFTDGNAEFDRLKSLARLGLAIGFSTEDISSPDGVPPRLAHLLESRMLDALRRFDEADEANIAEITATLPEAITVEDPDDLMQVLGVDDVDAWVAARLVDMPDHMKQGMGRVTFVPKYEAPVFTYGGNTAIVSGEYNARTNQAILYVDAAYVRSRLGGPGGDTAQDMYRELTAEDLIHEVTHFDHMYKTPLRVLAQWSETVRQEGRPLSPYTAAVAHPDLSQDSDLEEYATAGAWYFRDPDLLKVNGKGLRYQAFHARVTNAPDGI